MKFRNREHIYSHCSRNFAIQPNQKTETRSGKSTSAPEKKRMREGHRLVQTETVAAVAAVAVIKALAKTAEQ